VSLNKRFVGELICMQADRLAGSQASRLAGRLAGSQAGRHCVMSSLYIA